MKKAKISLKLNNGKIDMDYYGEKLTLVKMLENALVELLFKCKQGGH